MGYTSTKLKVSMIFLAIPFIMAHMDVVVNNVQRRHAAGVAFKNMGLPKAENLTQTLITITQDASEWLKVVRKERGTLFVGS